MTSDLELPLEVAEDEALEELLRAELDRRGGWGLEGGRGLEGGQGLEKGWVGRNTVGEV